MQNRIDLYINKTYKDYYDQLMGMANIEGIKFSTKIGEAVKRYIEESCRQQ